MRLSSWENNQFIPVYVPSSVPQSEVAVQCKITKPLENGQNLDGVSVRSVINNSMTLSHWTSSSPPSVEIVGNSVTSEELCDIGELTLRNWILKWLFFLQSKACGSLASALNLVIAAEQFDMPAMVCLFPYLLHNVITEGKLEAQDSIVKGLIAVIQVKNHPVSHNQSCSLSSWERILDIESCDPSVHESRADAVSMFECCVLIMTNPSFNLDSDFRFVQFSGGEFG